MKVIEVKNLSKYFGQIKAIDNISFGVEKGEIFGFLGPNGAGKTTTIRSLLDFIKPNAGKIKILGLDIKKDSVKIKDKIGYLSGDVKLYDWWTGKDHIQFLETIRGKSQIVKNLIKRFDFNPDIKARNLSSGNRQKLGLILTLMGKPELLILDEPTLGLDPLLQNIIYKTLKDFQAKGVTIFMSSHNLPEVERICNRVGIIKQGKLVAVENIRNLKAKRIFRIYLHFAQDFKEIDFSQNGVKIVEKLPEGLVLDVQGDINPLIKKLSQYQLKDLEIYHASLEDIFLEFYEKE